MTAPSDAQAREALARGLVNKIEHALGNDEWMEGTTITDAEWQMIVLALKETVIRSVLRSQPSRAEVIEECALLADEADRQDEIDNGIARTGAAAHAAKLIRALAGEPR